LDIAGIDKAQQGDQVWFELIVLPLTDIHKCRDWCR